MSRKEIYTAVALFVAFVLVFLLTSTCQKRGWQAKTDAALDSASAAQTRAQVNAALARAAEDRANVAAIERRAAQDSARRALAEADRLRAARRVIVPLASQPGAAPTVSDTLAAVVSALENCDQETVALRSAITQDSTALAKAAVTEAELRGSLALRTATNDDLTRTVGRLADQLKSADPPCRVLWMSCPTRKTVAVVTALGTALGTVVTINLLKQ